MSQIQSLLVFLNQTYKHIDLIYVSEDKIPIIINKINNKYPGTHFYTINQFVYAKQQFPYLTRQTTEEKKKMYCKQNKTAVLLVVEKEI